MVGGDLYVKGMALCRKGCGLGIEAPCVRPGQKAILAIIPSRTISPLNRPQRRAGPFFVHVQAVALVHQRKSGSELAQVQAPAIST